MSTDLIHEDSSYHGGDITYGEHLENAKRAADTVKALARALDLDLDKNKPDTLARQARDAIDWIGSL